MCFSSFFFFSPYISINCIRGSCRSVAAPACLTAPLPCPTPLGEHVLWRRPPQWLWFCPPCLRPHGPRSGSPPRGDFRSIPAGLPAATPALPPVRSAGRRPSRVALPLPVAQDADFPAAAASTCCPRRQPRWRSLRLAPAPLSGFSFYLTLFPCVHGHVSDQSLCKRDLLSPGQRRPHTSACLTAVRSPSRGSASSSARVFAGSPG